MRAIPAAELLDIWDRGGVRGPLQRTLDLLAAAFPDSAPEALAREPIGARDRRLLILRRGLFGSAIASTPLCPECGERLDLNFTVDDILLPPGNSGEPLSMDVGDYHVELRLPDTTDLASVPVGEGIDGVRAHLLARCVQGIARDGEPVTAAEMPPDVIGRIIAGMSEADPQADLQMRIICPACAHEWSAIFDIVSFLWSEIDSWAGRIMRDVYLLARACGWTESEILRMSPRRRQIYLSMAMQ